MTEEKINLKLVKDVTRILTESSSWKEDEPKTWTGRANLVADLMNAGKEEELIDRMSIYRPKFISYGEALTVQGTTTDCEDCEPDLLDDSTSDWWRGNHRLSKAYVSCTIKLLEYRQEARMSGKKLPKITYDEPEFLETKDYDRLKANITNLGESMIGYHSLELADGDLDKLSKSVSIALGRIVRAHLLPSDKPRNYGFHREKESFLGHKPWIVFQVMPPVIVSQVRKTTPELR